MLIKQSSIHEGTLGNGLEAGERLDIAIDVAHAITYLHMYTGMYIIISPKYVLGPNYPPKVYVRQLHTCST